MLLTVSILHEQLGCFEVQYVRRPNQALIPLNWSFKISVNADSSLELQMCNAQGGTKGKLSTQHLIVTSINTLT